mmetsp:Transcript_17897/g.22567  ORF Transcript_17897/g.22567 Transcript_17897/m.22567 type:complete len:463 (-) Transcript_17897:96-1484(-)|eukprot:CAMPEP_0203664770 /NCGR_PEP_ID=MMETSP0090-20130426/2119_1 /ASSEMBLY_ACC=CAM_ASM_001088 /TAXON_ID=426623 /ORGANISM="Chaetoceros affinis, Strain CCMP159" /LENGTH=462 /DNA_ID=CAMNT_0050528121 /DNA_START=191 /DNA_END=1579 /DNA_ORIENTATION=+
MKRRNIFKSSNDDLLPSLSASSQRINGSGRGIHMDAPIVRGWKNSSGYTKGSYFWLAGSLAAMFLSYRFMMYHYASTFLSCNGDFCTLKIVPPYREPKFTLKFHKDQIVTAKHIKVSSSGNFIPDPNDEEAPPEDRYHRHHHGRRESAGPGNNYKYNNNNGDGGGYDHEEEKFDSYGLVLNQYGKEIADLTKKEQELRRELADHYRKKDEMVMNGSMGMDSNGDNNNSNGIAFSKDEQDLMEQYGSAAMTDPELRQQFERQRQQLVEEQRKQQERKNRATEDMHAAKEYEYNMQLKQISDSKRRIQRDRKGFPDLNGLYQWSEWNGDQQYMVILRKYNIGHRKRRVQSLMRTIMNYAQGKRDRMTIRENRDICWQGIIGLVFGMFSFLLCVLIGQFVDPQPRRTIRSPNNANSVRRRHVNHLNAQAPPVIPKTFASSTNSTRSNVPVRQKAYGGYVPGKSTY